MGRFTDPVPLPDDWPYSSRLSFTIEIEPAKPAVGRATCDLADEIRAALDHSLENAQWFGSVARVDPERRFPTVSLLALGGVAMLFCFLRLADVIAALVVIRILLQFIVQAVGVMVLRKRRPDMPRPFRMWLYPVPALLAIGGFVFILLSRQNFLREIRYAVAILVAGLVIYFIRAWKRKEWPFERTEHA